MGVPVDSSLETWLEASVEHVQRVKRAKRLGGKKMSETAIVVQRDVTPVLEFTPEQRAMIRDTYANGADEKEFQVLLEVAKLRRLNPLLRQIHFVKRWNKDLGRMVWAAQVSVDGLRAIAERTGKYDGQDEPEFGPMSNGFPEWAKVKVYRKDWTRPAVGTAYWSEYVQRTKEGSPTRFWKEMPRVMLAKCAEAIAMRKAFPEDMGGLYVDEEMQQADNHAPTENGAPVISMHVNPGERADDAPRESAELDDVTDILTDLERRIAAANPVTWDMICSWRELLGDKAKPSPLGKRIAALATGDAIAPSQRGALMKLVQRVNRQVKRHESIAVKPGPAESFTDPDDGTEAFAPEREPGADEDEL